MSTTTTRRRMRSTTVALGVTALMASGLSGCASEPDYAAVCVDPQTEERVDDDVCDDDRDYDGVSSGFFWYYLGASAIVPGVGSRASGGTYKGSTLSGNVTRGGMPSTGGGTVRSSTSKGGFGSSNRGFSS